MVDVFHFLELRAQGLTNGHRYRQCHKVVKNLLEDVAAKPVHNLPCEFSGEPRATFLMDFSPNMLRVASTHGDHSVRVTDIRTGKCTHILTGHPRTPWCIAFNPTSNDILASGCLGGEIRIWDLLGGGSEVLRSPCGGQVITSMAFHPAGQVLVFAALNNIYFWDWSKSAPFSFTQTAHDYERIRWLRFDPFGHYLYTGIANNTTVHRDRDLTAQVVPISDDSLDLATEASGLTSEERSAQQQMHRMRYQSLLHRFMAYQQDRNVRVNRYTSSPGPRSPVHEEGLESARQYARHLTNLESRSLLPRAQDVHDFRDSEIPSSSLFSVIPSQPSTSRASNAAQDSSYGEQPENFMINRPLPGRQDDSQSGRRWGRYEPLFFSRSSANNNNNNDNSSQDNNNNSNNNNYNLGDGSVRVDVPVRSSTTTERPFTVTWLAPENPGQYSRPPEVAGSSAASSSFHHHSSQARNENAASESLDANEFEILPVDQERESWRATSNNGSSTSGTLTNADGSLVASWDDLRSLLNRIGHRSNDASSASSGAATVTGVPPPCPLASSSSSAASTAEGSEPQLRPVSMRVPSEPAASARSVPSLSCIVSDSGSADSSIPGQSSGVNFYNRNQNDSQSRFSRLASSLTTSRLHSHSRFNPSTDQDSANRSTDAGPLASDFPSVHFRFNSNSGHSWRRQMINRHHSLELNEGSDFSGHSSLLDRSVPRHVIDQTSQTLGAMNLPESADQCTDVAGLGEPADTSCLLLHDHGYSFTNDEVDFSPRLRNLEGIKSSNSEHRQGRKRSRNGDTADQRTRDISRFESRSFFANCRTEHSESTAQRCLPYSVSSHTSLGNSRVKGVVDDGASQSIGDGGDARPSIENESGDLTQEQGKLFTSGNSETDNSSSVGFQLSTETNTEDVNLETCQLLLPSETSFMSAAVTKASCSRGKSNNSTSTLFDHSGTSYLEGTSKCNRSNPEMYSPERPTSESDLSLGLDTSLFNDTLNNSTLTYSSPTETLSPPSTSINPVASATTSDVTLGSTADNTLFHLLSTSSGPNVGQRSTSGTSSGPNVGQRSTSGTSSSLEPNTTSDWFPRHRHTSRGTFPDPDGHSSRDGESRLSRFYRRHSLLRSGLPYRRAPTSSILRSTLSSCQSSSNTTTTTSTANSYLYRDAALSSESRLGFGSHGDAEQRSAFSVFTAPRSSSGSRTSSSFFNPASASPPASSASASQPAAPRQQPEPSTSSSATQSEAPGHLDAVRDVQERLQQAVQQLREVQSSVRELTLSTPHQMCLVRSDSVTEYLERRVSELDRRISDLENNYNTRIRELGHDFFMRRIHSSRERRRMMNESAYTRERQSYLSQLQRARESPKLRELHRARELLRARELQRIRDNRRVSTGDSAARVRAAPGPPSERGDAPPIRPRQLLQCLARPTPAVPESLRARSRHLTANTMPTAVTIHPPRSEDSRDESSNSSGGSSNLGSQRYGLNLQQLYLHPDYSTSILDDTINRPNEAMQRLMNRTIAGAFLNRDEQAVANNIVPQTHRIQRWDVSKCVVPDISNAAANIIVKHCKLHNDASCDLSKDGTLLVTFVSSHRGFPDNNILGVFSLQNETLAQCLYTKSFGPNAISVSISPVNRYVLVGLAARRFFFSSVNQMVAQVYKLERKKAGENSMKHITDLFHPANQEIRNHVSVNSARWLPGLGGGMVYGTNRGDLHFCRPGSRKVHERDSPKPRRGLFGLDSLSRFHRGRSAHNTIATQTTTVSIRRNTSTQTPSQSLGDDNE